MELPLSPEARMLRDTVRAFAERELAPRAAAADEEESLPPENLAGLAGLGLMGMALPEEYGGGGLDMSCSTMVIEEIARACASTALSFGAHTILTALFIHRHADPDQRRRFLPGMASGEEIGAWALTEPEAGSDALALSTRAVREGDGYLLEGRKMFITNAAIAHWIVVFAKTRPEAGAQGISTFVVAADSPGLSVGAPIKKMGCRASPTSEVVLEGVRVPAGHRLGEEGDGARQILEGLNYERTVLSGMPLGIARAALEASSRYAKERRQFGRPIGEFQMVQQMLADMYARIQAARALVYAAAGELDAGGGGGAGAAAAKLIAGEVGVRAGLDAIQIHGGYGYTREFPVERYLRDAKLVEIGAGTSQILRRVIAREVLR